MPQHPSNRKRARRHEHPTRLHQDSGHRHLAVRAATESRGDSTPDHEHAELAAAETPVSTSFNMLSVQPAATSTQSSSERRSTSRASSHKSTTRTTATSDSQTPDTVSSTLVGSASTFSAEALSTLETPQQLQVQLTSSIESTTLFVSGTSSFPSATPVTSMTLLGTTSAPRQLVTITTVLVRPASSPSHRPLSSAVASPIVHPPTARTYISPALIVFMVIGGFGALGMSLYVFRRIRYRAIHVSRSQFQITPPGPSRPAVAGSESNNSFVSGGLGRLDQRQKNDQMDPAGSETPLWGGREKFSPRPDLGTLDLPPAAHINERIPVDRRRSFMDTFRHVAPGRLSRNGPGWNQIPDAPPVPTVRITDVDTNHHRGASGSSFSESPDPNLASIQVASVTRTLSATASYRGPPSSRLTMGLEDPRPAPRAPPKAAIKAPPKAQVYDRIPPVPRIPDILGINADPAGQKRHMDTHGRGRIALTDISKPLPVVVAKPEMHKDESNRAAGETDPMAMYAKYSASLGVRNGSPEPIRRETSMAKKIAQIANSGTRPTAASASQTSLSSRDTRALAAAAGVASPALNEDRTPFRSNQKPPTGSGHLPPMPVTPGWSEVGNMMLRPFDQSGSMLPASLETPAIGPDGRSSYLSTNPGVEAGWRDRVGQGPGPLHAIIAKPSENDISTLAASLRPSATDDSDRKTIMSAYSQDFIPLSQQAHMQQNPDYRSPTYSIYNYYGPDRISRVPGMIHGEQEIGGAL